VEYKNNKCLFSLSFSSDLNASNLRFYDSSVLTRDYILSSSLCKYKNNQDGLCSRRNERGKTKNLAHLSLVWDIWDDRIYDYIFILKQYLLITGAYLYHKY
jgi:hypothetical protein